MILEATSNPGVVIHSIWSCSPMGYNENVVFTWGCLSHSTSDMGKSS